MGNTCCTYNYRVFLLFFSTTHKSNQCYRQYNKYKLSHIFLSPLSFIYFSLKIITNKLKNEDNNNNEYGTNKHNGKISTLKTCIISIVSKTSCSDHTRHRCITNRSEAPRVGKE